MPAPSQPRLLVLALVLVFQLESEAVKAIIRVADKLEVVVPVVVVVCGQIIAKFILATAFQPHAVEVERRPCCTDHLRAACLCA